MKWIETGICCVYLRLWPTTANICTTLLNRFHTLWLIFTTLGLNSMDRNRSNCKKSVNFDTRKSKDAKNNKLLSNVMNSFFDFLNETISIWTSVLCTGNWVPILTTVLLYYCTVYTHWQAFRNRQFAQQ